MTVENKIEEFHRLLNANSSRKKKEWWGIYLRNSISFIGVGIPEIKILFENIEMRCLTKSKAQ
jgi:hypothetical protein